MTSRKVQKDRLERLGFVHVAGWVRVSDAPAMRRKIEAAREDVEMGKRDEAKGIFPTPVNRKDTK